MEIMMSALADDEHIAMIRRLAGKRRLFLVGGTLRDAVLGIVPRDYDFAVSGSGITLARAVAKKTGGSYVLLSRDDDEARVVKDELIYDFIGIGRSDIRSDLERRDFTINAMALDLDTLEFLDPFGGMKDLKKRIIRTVSDVSLSGDPLRVLRGFRFALELDLTLDRHFLRLAQDVSLKKTAAERIGYELMRIMSAPFSYGALKNLDELGIFRQIFPEADKIIGDPELWGHSMQTYYAVERLTNEGFFRTELKPEFDAYFAIDRKKPLVKLAGLLHDVAKPDTFLLKKGEVHFYGHDAKGARTVEVLGYKRLKLSRADVTVLRKLVKEHMRPHLLATSAELTDRAIRRFFRNLGDDYFGSIMIAWADGYATGGRTKHLEDTFRRMVNLKRMDDAKPKVERLVDGYDLIDLGYEPGPIFKIILQELLDLQLEGKITTKEEGRKAARELFSKKETPQ
jgi:poly(A) polymerase